MTGFLPIQSYLPHRGTLLLIDRLLDAGEEHAVAQLRIRRDSPFMENGTVPTWVAIEYMAQTIAAWAGFQAVSRNEPVKIGFLLGSRKFEALQPRLKADTLLRVETHCELQAENGLGMFSCRVLEGETLVAQAQISVYEPEDGAAFVQAAAAGRSNKNE